MRAHLAVLAAAVVVVASGSCAIDAQAPERPQEVEVPGLGVMLKVGWQLLFHDGCRFAVPASWRPDPDEAMVRAADGSSLTIQALKIVSWPAHKAHMRGAGVHVKAVHEDSSRRLWLELDADPRVEHYIAVVDGATVCVGWLEMRPGAASNAWDTIKRIADSIGTAPENWPPEDNR